MSPLPHSNRESRLLLGIFLLALAAHLFWVTQNWRSGFMAGHEFRQTQTALVSYYIDRQDNFGLLYETPLVGKPWISILLEVPVYEWCVVGVHRLTDLPLPQSGRWVSLVCFYLTLPALYLLLGRGGLAPPRRLLVLALVLTCPVYIFYTRAVLMESMEVLCCAWFLYGYVMMMDRRRWFWFLLAAVAGTGASLIKGSTLAVWLWPAAACVVVQLFRQVRSRAGWGAIAETIFWGLAGIVVPIGALQLWVSLTDPFKEAHLTAWIFTSKNLSGDNWGFTNLAARFSGETWSVLFARWREAMMPAWVAGALLVPGCLFLPRARWLAMGLTAFFLLAQVMFPFAYAYQDYYFYACAVFLVAAIGWLASALLDSRAPRWLAWPLLAVPFVAQVLTYHGFYRPQQLVRTDGGFSYTAVLRDLLPPESVIVVSGSDWAGAIPYYAQRKALMILNGKVNDVDYLRRAFADLWDEEVGALVMIGDQRYNHAMIGLAMAAFDLDPAPTFSHQYADIYVNRRYRDRLKEDLRGAGNYGDLRNEPSPPLPSKPAQPYRVNQGLARTGFFNIAPAPLRAHFGFGLGYIWVDAKKVIFAHPECDVWLHPPPGATRIEWDFGVIDDAWQREGGRTDGVEFIVTGILPGGQSRELYRRFLDPAQRTEDRGTQRVAIPYQPVPGEILQFSNRPGPGSSFDWAYWMRIDVVAAP